jgi:HemK-related putative methylase
LVLKYWLEHGRATPRTARVGGLRLHVPPTVFHPKYFGSSRILMGYVSRLPLGGRRFLDMGTGTGIVGIVAALQGAVVTAVDINPAAVEAARGNAAANGVSMEVLESDLFERVGARFDLIAWNPPFFPREALGMAGRAFFAGEGHRTIARFAAEARAHLDSAGRIYIVLSEDADVPAVARLFEGEGFHAARVHARRWGLGERMFVLEIR